MAGIFIGFCIEMEDGLVDGIGVICWGLEEDGVGLDIRGDGKRNWGLGLKGG